MVLAQARQAANSSEPLKHLARLATINYQGMTGSISFDANETSAMRRSLSLLTAIKRKQTDRGEMTLFNWYSPCAAWPFAATHPFSGGTAAVNALPRSKLALPRPSLCAATVPQHFDSQLLMLII
jgi:hypothetical protein